jgi:hypothetical protein
VGGSRPREREHHLAQEHHALQPEVCNRAVLRPAERPKLPPPNAFGSTIALALLFVALGPEIVEASAAEYSRDSQSEIQTDRPDVTNSSVVVPTGSLQAENGINLTARRASRAIDGTNTRIRDCHAASLFHLGFGLTKRSQSYFLGLVIRSDLTPCSEVHASHSLDRASHRPGSSPEASAESVDTRRNEASAKVTSIRRGQASPKD